MSLPKTVSENSFDINLFIFIFCQLYVLLEFKFFLIVSAFLTILSLLVCALGVLYLIQLKRQEPERQIFLDISKNLFFPLVLCVTWVILYDVYSEYTLYTRFFQNFYPFSEYPITY